MNLKVLKWQILRGSLARRLLLRAFLFASAMAFIPFIHIVRDIRTIERVPMSFDECPLNIFANQYVNFTGFLKPLSSFTFPLFGSALMRPCQESENFTMNMLKELIEKDLLDSGAKALCLGEGSASAVLALRELGFTNALGVNRHPLFSIMRKTFVYELGFKDNSFDFVFSRALDSVSVPALLVREIERVLRPGGTGALLVGADNFYSGGLIRSASPVSSFLRNSNIVHVCGIGPYTLVIFKKYFVSVASFEHYRLPDECPSITRNKPFMKNLEPLAVADKEIGQVVTELSYLPKFINMSSRNRLIYVNIGAGEFLTSSIAKMSKPFYTIKPQALNVFVVDHDPSVLSSYVKKPGVTFVYHPGLAGNKPTDGFDSDGDLSDALDNEGFDFIRWFKETRSDGDMVVLMMNAGAVELKIVFELFESGAICHVDELFLRCSESSDCNNSVCGECTSLFTGLRNSGVFVHRWWGD